MSRWDLWGPSTPSYELILLVGLGLIALAFLIDRITSRPTDDTPSDLTEESNEQ